MNGTVALSIYFKPRNQFPLSAVSLLMMSIFIEILWMIRFSILPLQRTKLDKVSNH